MPPVFGSKPIGWQKPISLPMSDYVRNLLIVRQKPYALGKACCQLGKGPGSQELAIAIDITPADSNEFNAPG